MSTSSLSSSTLECMAAAAASSNPKERSLPLSATVLVGHCHRDRGHLVSVLLQLSISASYPPPFSKLPFKVPPISAGLLPWSRLPGTRLKLTDAGILLKTEFINITMASTA